MKDTTLLHTPLQLEVYTQNYGPPKSWSPISKISRLPLGNPETKWHLGADLMAKHREYYKGEGGGFPQVRVMMSLVSSCLP